MNTPRKMMSPKPLTECSGSGTPLRFQRFGVVEEWYNPTKILIDIDGGKRMLREFWFRFPRVCRVTGIRPRWIRLDKTAHGWHVVICLTRRREPWEILSLQAILFSDWRREAMNWARLASNPTDSFALKRWNILYREKVKR